MCMQFAQDNFRNDELSQAFLELTELIEHSITGKIQPMPIEWLELRHVD